MSKTKLFLIDKVLTKSIDRVSEKIKLRYLKEINKRYQSLLK